MLNAGSRRDLTAKERASFSGDPVWGPVSGPRSLYRFLGTWRDTKTGCKGRNNPRGVFWVSAAVVQILRAELLDQMEFELSGQRPRPAMPTRRISSATGWPSAPSGTASTA